MHRAHEMLIVADALKKNLNYSADLSYMWNDITDTIIWLMYFELHFRVNIL